MLSHDVVLVGGGNTLNMLAIWRAHGLDRILREAWEAGVVLAGGSAGANCWFEATTTDSYLLGRADPLPDGIGLVPGSFCPHFDSEPARRPSTGGSWARVLPPGIACDDLAAVHILGTEVAEVVVSDRDAGARRVAPGAHGDVIETPFETRILEGHAVVSVAVGEPLDPAGVVAVAGGAAVTFGEVARERWPPPAR